MLVRLWSGVVQSSVNYRGRILVCVSAVPLYDNFKGELSINLNDLEK